jgi:hypothetical protein
LAVLVGSLSAVEIVMEQAGPLAYPSLAEIGPPWVLPYEEDVVYEAVNAIPPRSLTVLAEATEQTAEEGDTPPDYVAISFTPATHEAVVADEAASAGSVLAIDDVVRAACTSARLSTPCTRTPSGVPGPVR